MKTGDNNDDDRFDIQRAQDYPYERPSSSYLFIKGGEAIPYKTLKDEPMSIESFLRLRDEKVISVPEFLTLRGFADAKRVPVIGYGSNPAVTQLAMKFGDGPTYPAFHGNPTIPVVKAKIKDFDVVYMGIIGPYGAVPATLIPSPGTEVVIWLTYLTADQLVQMHYSEHLGEFYDYGRLEQVSILLENGHRLKEEPYIYLDRLGALYWNGHPISLAKIEAKGRHNEALLERELLDRLRERFAPSLTLDAFVLENIRNAATRKKRNDELGQMTKRFWCTPTTPAFRMNC
jgi:hypothetical protein